TILYDQQYIKTLPSCIISIPTSSSSSSSSLSTATLLPYTVAATFDNLNQSGKFPNTTTVFYPFSGYTITRTTTATATTTTTTTLIPAGETQLAFLSHPNANISTRTYFQQPYPNFQPSTTAAVTATTFLPGNILKNTGITGIPFSTSNKRKSSRIYGNRSDNKLYRDNHFATISESSSSITPVNSKKRV
ncbi:hypothetical protein LOAG_14332, partial [Loa loa]